MTTSISSNDKLKSFLKLPVPVKPTPLAKPFPKPVADPPKLDGYGSIAGGTVSGYAEIADIVRDERTRTTTILAKNSGSDQYPWGIHRYTELVTYIANDDKPAISSVQSTYTISIEQKGRILKWTGILDFSSDEKTFFYKYKRILEKNGKVIKEKEWVEDIPRLW
jgi:hypothetical protein